MLWRLKWRLTGVLANFMHVVLCDEGRQDPSPLGLITLIGATWLLASGAFAGVSRMTGGLLTVPAVIVAGTMGIMALLTTVASAWYIVEWYREPPLLRSGAEA